MFACADQAACVGVNKTGVIVLLTGMYGGGALLLLLIAILWKTPALEFIIAFLFGKPVVAMTNRSARIQFKNAKPSSEGMLEIRGVGPIIVAENSYTRESTSGALMYFCFGEYASTLPLWWVYTVNKIRDYYAKVKGKPIQNVSQLGEKVGRKFDEDTNSWVVTPAQKDAEGNEMKVVAIQPYQTIRLHDMGNMFPFNQTPALVESRIVHEVAKKMKFWNSMNAQVILTFAVGFVVVVVGAYIAWKFFGGGAPEIHVTVDSVGNLIKANQTMVG